jgi:pilus assembly protein FimV
MPYKTWLLTGVFLLMPWVAHAVGLGKLTILSALGRPLLAEVDLVSVQKDELATLTARLASPEAFTQANVQYSPALVGVRLSIERRADGLPYIKIISTRPVNEPFIDLLIELSWAQGRLVREYTALIDPDGYAPGTPIVQAVPPGEVAPVVAPESQPIVQAAPPVELAPAVTSELQPIEVKPAATAPAVARPVAVPAKAESKEYGPVRRGETLFTIATRTKPEGVTLDQMLVSLYRGNPDAFAGNMNNMKTGAILRIPEKQQITTTGQSEAVKVVRVQAANWNAYREKLAAAAAEAPGRDSRSAASGKITTSVDDKAAGKETPKEVLRLSKSEPIAPGKAGRGTGAPRTAAERVRMLEEEAVAREKALAEASDRVAQLEKTIKDMQRLLEIKGQVPGAQATKPVPQPAPGAKPEATPAMKSDQVAKAEPAKAEPAKAGPAKMEPARDTGKAPAEAPKGEQKAAPAEQPAAAEPPQGGVPKAEAPKTEPGAKAQPKPKPITIVQEPPGLLDQILGEPLYLGAAAGLLALLGGAGYWFVRRRRAQVVDEEDQRKKTEPELDKGAAATPAVAAPMSTERTGGGEDVDRLTEADLYLNFGRYEQAEEVLKEVVEKNPKNEEAQLKLLQIYAGRKDQAAFERIARNLHTQTVGAGNNWLKAAAMGYAFNPGNALYAAGKSAPVAAMPAAGGAAAATDVDFNFKLPPTSIATEADAEFDGGAASKTMIMQPGEMARAAEVQDITHGPGVAHEAAPAAAIPNFALDIPGAIQSPAVPDNTLDMPRDKAVTADVTGDSAAPIVDMIDFDFNATAPAPATPAAGGKTHDGTVARNIENQDQAAGLDMDFEHGDRATVAAVPDAKPEAAKSAGTTTVFPDFKLELADHTAASLAPELKLDDINLNLDDTTKTAVTKAPEAEPGAKDDRWYDVQTKFDLAKAYQEMGDKDGAHEILQEVIAEGDAGQQAAAKKLLDSLG